MAQLSVPSAPREYSTQYRVLLGVDFRADQTEVDRRRSPDMVNMISDFGGNPVKRDGYRTVASEKMWLCEVDGIKYGIYASGNAFEIAEVEMNGYELDVNAAYVSSSDVGDIKAVFGYQHKLYIVSSNCLLEYDAETDSVNVVGTQAGMMSVSAVGESAPANTDTSIIPLTVFKLKPDGTGGNTLDNKNLMTIYQTFSFEGDGTSTQYKIPIYEKMGTWVKVEVMDANGVWQVKQVTTDYTLGTSTAVTGLTLDGKHTATNNIVDTTVTFTSAPSAPPIAGEDNVRITICPYSMEEVQAGVHRGYYNEHFANLLSCYAATMQGNRMFIAEKYRVYWSKISSPFVIPDLSWFDVDSEIVGFSRNNNNLLVLAKDTGKSTIYLAAEQMRTVDSETGETEIYFTVKESNSGIGAIAPKCIATLIDEPMFLSSTGVYGVLTNYLSDKYAVNRSSRINRKLCQEPNLDKAVGIAFNDYFYIAVNGRMYVLDGRHKESDMAGNKPLEAYYFEGLPAIENMFVVGNKMYFTDDEKTYSWNEDLPETERYIDDGHLSEDEAPVFVGEPVRARWCSVYDDDGAPNKLKTLMKKGSMITLVPHYKSGCEVTLAKDGDAFEYLGSFNSDINTFDSIDFNSFSFSSNQVAIDNYTNKKVKKYKRLQIQIENNNAEPFGLTQITKTYTYGNYAKR